VLNSDSDSHGLQTTGRGVGGVIGLGLLCRRGSGVESDRRSREAQVALVPAAQEAPPVSLRPPRDPPSPPPGAPPPSSTSPYRGALAYPAAHTRRGAPAHIGGSAPCPCPCSASAGETGRTLTDQSFRTPASFAQRASLMPAP